MKIKLSALILMLILAVALVGCDKTPSADPVGTTEQTVSETDTPADETDKPSDETDKPSDETDKPSDETDKPSDETDKPSDETDKPSDETDKPADETDKPSDETDKPSDETDKPADPADKDRLKADLVSALRELLSGSSVDPYAVIPETMRADYKQKHVTTDELINSYTNAVSVSSIPTEGAGQQWNMVLNNLEQSAVFFNVLSVVDNLTTVSIQTFETFFDKNPEETAIHSFEESIYSVTIHYDDETIAYALDYTATIPALGEQKIQIALNMDRETREKSVRIQLGNGNALAYTVAEDSYTFALKLLGLRHAYFTVSLDEDGNVYGHINEFLTVAGASIQSAADFYITEDYVTAVGNKANGMLLFDGRICELYRVEDGRLVGYEVKETESLLGIEFDTLWFDLSDVKGINAIRYLEATDETEAAFYVNGSDRPWENKTVGFLNPSRRFDIEFRTRYYTVYDTETDEYKTVSAEVPMLFVQEEYLESLAKDIKSANNISVSLGVVADELEKLMEDYHAYIPAFDEHKAAITTDVIEEFIGEAVSFA